MDLKSVEYIVCQTNRRINVHRHAPTEWNKLAYSDVVKQMEFFTDIYIELERLLCQ